MNSSDRGPVEGGSIEWLIHDLFDEKTEVAIGELLEPSGLTRQAIQYHLRKLIETGDIEPIGAGRARRYRRPLLYEARFSNEGLEEDQVWRDVKSSVPELASMNKKADLIANYAFTEMLNNAIDHSGSDVIRVTIGMKEPRFIFRVIDEGIGAFESVKRHANLEDLPASIQEISKGKMTTDPARHTGQGIFFTSKVTDWFSLACNGWRWLVDNDREDQALGASNIRIGTVATFEVDANTQTELNGVFDQYTDQDTLAFDRTRTVVKLFELDMPFVSRSEAKRLTRNLERFREVVVDFQGIEQIGQGFADELFRVWARHHPETQLVPVNMNDPVARTVQAAVKQGFQ